MCEVIWRLTGEAETMECSLSVSESEESDPNKDSVLGLVLLQERGRVWRVAGSPGAAA
jgi:hypothetical protein